MLQGLGLNIQSSYVMFSVAQFECQTFGLAWKNWGDSTLLIHTLICSWQSLHTGFDKKILEKYVVVPCLVEVALCQRFNFFSCHQLSFTHAWEQHMPQYRLLASIFNPCNHSIVFGSQAKCHLARNKPISKASNIWPCLFAFIKTWIFVYENTHTRISRVSCGTWKWRYWSKEGN